MKDSFQDIDRIVVEPLKFKAKLAIGEDAYTSLRVKNTVVQVWDVAGVATTAAVVAKSSVVASTFFAPTGWLAALGIGTAVTPIGWVVAAGVVTGGAWFGITRHLKKASASKVTVVPKFINTPLDVLALGLFDLMMPLALKVAAVDGRVERARRQQLDDYFVGEWGYDADFVDAGIQHIEARLGDVSIQDLAQTLAQFASQNRDCNFRMMSQEILEFLREIAAADGEVEDSEENAIAEIERLFKRASRFSMARRLRNGWRFLRQGAGRLLQRRSSTQR
jgi:uncharacterized tellurite resistance protein B-like protein